MRSYTPKTLATKIITWMMVIGVALGSFQVAAPTQAASNASSNEQAAPSARTPFPTSGNGETPIIPARIDKGIIGKTGPLNLMIELNGLPAVVVQNNAKVNGKTTDSLSLTKIARDQIAKNLADQNTVLSSLSKAGIGGKPIFQVQKAYNGIAIRVDGANVEQIKKLPGIKAIHALENYQRENVSSVPLIGAPIAWGNYGITGANIRIGIIDTGIDYVHTDFGGPGTSEAYSVAYSATTIPVVYNNQQLFPSSKVIGGYDFAGDAYNADPASLDYNPIPSPDPNPEDCSSTLGGGHGSHVAGTAAGFGVNGNGTTYQGPYDTNIPTTTLRIGPGVAPQAKLYALRVFGCQGSTDLVTQAIDWAIDPNNDGDFSDHLDVINMSLGSNFGDASTDSSTVASNNAVLAGTIVVASAGNANDVYYVNGSPATADRAISVAASADAQDAFDAFRVISPPSVAGYYPFSRAVYGPPVGDPPITATLAYPSSVTYTGTPDSGGLTDKLGCVPFNPEDAALLDGKIALIDRGSCTFKTKTLNAQNAGAVAVIIVSNNPVFDGSGLADDATITQTITIPTVLTSQQAGAALKPHIGEGIVVELDNNYPVTFKTNNPGQVDTLASFSSRGPRIGDSALKPDITAPGLTIVSVNSGSGNQAESLSGTSMAAPHMTGVMALLRQLHPNWTVEELKALVMNTANQDLYTGQNHTGVKYGPSRVGAGRVIVQQAITNTVLAYGLDTPGAVSVSFGSLDVTTPISLTRQILVENKGETEVTYNVGYNDYVNTPGVNYSFPNGESVTIPAHGSTSLTVQLSADPALMKNYRDPSAPTRETTYNFFATSFLNEKSGMIVLTPTVGSAVNLRLPVFSSPRPASIMSTSESSLVFTGTNTTTSLHLTGQGINTGSTFPTDTVSLVMPFELAATNTITTNTGARDANIQYVGVTSDANEYPESAEDDARIYFGISTYGNWSTPANEATFYVLIDANQDGNYDYQLSNVRVPNSDAFITQVVDLSDNSAFPEDYLNGYPANTRNTAVFNNNVMVLPVYAADLSLGSRSRFDYQVISVSGNYGIVDELGTFTYDYLNPGIDFSGGPLAVASSSVPMYKDLPGTTIPATYNQGVYKTNRSQGVVLFHLFNATGNRTQVIRVNGPTSSCATSGQDTIVTKSTDDESCGTLRHAIEFAGTPGRNSTITFAIADTTPVNGSYIVVVTSPLPNVPSGVTINGGSCANGTPNITIQGSGFSGPGFYISTGPVTLKNIEITGFGGPQLQIESPGKVNAPMCLKVVGGGAI